VSGKTKRKWSGDTQNGEWMGGHGGAEKRAESVKTNTAKGGGGVPIWNLKLSFLYFYSTSNKKPCKMVLLCSVKGRMKDRKVGGWCVFTVRRDEWGLGCEPTTRCPVWLSEYREKRTKAQGRECLTEEHATRKSNQGILEKKKERMGKTVGLVVLGT